MSDATVYIAAQVFAALLLGAFFGLERRLRGYPDASLFHATVAAAGFVSMLAARPATLPIATLTAGGMILSFAAVMAARALLQWCVHSSAAFADSGADVFTTGGALAVGLACGTGDMRSVAAVMLLMTLVSLMRPLDRRAPAGLSRGDVDAPPAPPVAANDDLPTAASICEGQAIAPAASSVDR